ncbi:hypothetical protein IMZ48_18820 [Candidatus Bathyarchaeota archaeon]|nr:hypothetical protein [Candidatus Bathyarchaeota archaeon]
MNPSYQTPVYGGIRHPDDAVAIGPHYPDLTMATSRSTEVLRPGRPAARAAVGKQRVFARVIPCRDEKKTPEGLTPRKLTSYPRYLRSQGAHGPDFRTKPASRTGTRHSLCYFVRRKHHPRLLDRAAAHPSVQRPKHPATEAIEAGRARCRPPMANGRLAAPARNGDQHWTGFRCNPNPSYAPGSKAAE